MRELVLYVSMSLDGLVASDREHPGVAIADAEVKQWKLEQISKAGAHLMGRTTYQEMSAYWPDSDDAYAVPMHHSWPSRLHPGPVGVVRTWPNMNMWPPWHPKAVDAGNRCRSARRSPNASPIRSPDSNSSDTKNVSRADNVAPINAAASPSLSVSGGLLISGARSVRDRTIANCRSSPAL